MGWRWSQERQDSIIVIFVTFSRKVLGRIGYRWALKRGKAINHRPRITVVTHANGIRIVGIRYVKVYLLYYFFFFVVGCVDPIDCIFVLVIIANFDWLRNGK